MEVHAGHQHSGEPVCGAETNVSGGTASTKANLAHRQGSASSAGAVMTPSGVDAEQSSSGPTLVAPLIGPRAPTADAIASAHVVGPGNTASAVGTLDGASATDGALVVPFAGVEVAALSAESAVATSAAGEVPEGPAAGVVAAAPTASAVGTTPGIVKSEAEAVGVGRACSPGLDECHGMSFRAYSFVSTIKAITEDTVARLAADGIHNMQDLLQLAELPDDAIEGFLDGTGMTRLQMVVLRSRVRSLTA